jgi:hypothetical protein
MRGKILLINIICLLCVISYIKSQSRLNILDEDWSPIGATWLYKNQYKDTQTVKYIQVQCHDSIYNKLGNYYLNQTIKSYGSKVHDSSYFKRYIFTYLDSSYNEIVKRDTFLLKNTPVGLFDYNDKIKYVIEVYRVASDDKSVFFHTYPRITDKWIFVFGTRFSGDLNSTNVKLKNINMKSWWVNLQESEKSTKAPGYKVYSKIGSTGYFFRKDATGKYFYSGDLIYYFDPTFGTFYPNSTPVILSVEDKYNKFAEAYTVSAYPNPAINTFTLNHNGSIWDKNYTITLYDASGKRLSVNYTHQGSYIDVDISGLPLGLYYCTWQNGNKETGSEKVVKR